MSENNHQRHQVGRVVNRPLPTHAKEFNKKPYLRPHNLGPQGHNVTIRMVAWVEYFNTQNNQWSEVPALFFFMKDSSDNRYLSLSSDTILDQVIQATGKEDPNTWPGQTICIFNDVERVRGVDYTVIRVKATDPQLPAAHSPEGPKKPQVVAPSSPEMNRESTDA